MLRVIIDNGGVCVFMSAYFGYICWRDIPDKSKTYTITVQKYCECILALFAIVVWNYVAVMIDRVGNKIAIYNSRMVLRSMRNHPNNRLTLQNRIGSLV